jgi:hypothetical protein
MRETASAVTRRAATPGLARWVLIVGTGEIVGFTFPAVAGVLAGSSPVGTMLIVGAGFIEGVILGGSQYLAMRRDVAGLRPGAWIVLTGGGAVVAYVCGMLPSSLSDWSGWPAPVQFAGLAVLTITILVSIGAAQWIELRHRLRAAAWWILGTAVAWIVGLGAFFAIAPPLWHEGQPVGTAIAIGLGAGVAMAVAMALVTGLTFRWLVEHDRAPSTPRRPRRTSFVGPPGARGVHESGYEGGAP